MVAPTAVKTRARRVSTRVAVSPVLPKRVSRRNKKLEAVSMSANLAVSALITSSPRKRQRTGRKPMIIKASLPEVVEANLKSDDEPPVNSSAVELEKPSPLVFNMEENARRSSLSSFEHTNKITLDNDTIFSPGYSSHKTSQQDGPSVSGTSEPSKASTNHQTSAHNPKKTGADQSTATSPLSVNLTLTACSEKEKEQYDIPVNIEDKKTDVSEKEGSKKHTELEKVVEIVAVVSEDNEGHVESDDLDAAVSRLECTEEEDYGEDEVEDFDPFLFIKKLPHLSEVVPAGRPHLLPKQTRSCPPVALVLDLDETLVHSSLEPCQDADFTFPVHFINQTHTVYVKQRPFLSRFMERVSQIFEIIIFTASQSIYADQLLNILDPQKKLIRHRVFRDSCVYVEGNFLKDLSILGRDLAKVAIIDNSPQAFGFQVENGIPIVSWFDDTEDRALENLLPFLETLADVEDVRPIITKKFNLKESIDSAPEPRMRRSNP